MTHFNAKLWNIHQLCVLQVLNAEESNPARKKGRKLAEADKKRGRKLVKAEVS